MGLIYLDSCVVIFAVEDESSEGEFIRQKLADLGDEEVMITPLVTMECVTGPLRDDNLVLHDHYIRALSQFEKRELGEEQFLRAASLRVKHGLKTPDALHLAAAQLHGCRELWTRDSNLVSAAPGFAIDQQSQ